MVVPWIGTEIIFFLAFSTPLRIASGTSFALPRPYPTFPLPSPTTTRAEKLNRRPPLTTLAVRLMWITRSVKFVSLLSTRCNALLLCSLESQTSFTCRIGESLNTAMIQKAVAVENYLFNVFCQSLFGNLLTNNFGSFHIAAVLDAVTGCFSYSRSSSQSFTGLVFDNLCINMFGATEYAQTRAL